MSVCPRCDRPIPQTALSCPYCKLTLKAHGHPGMTLYRAESNTPLCATCVYDADDSCNFPKRPDAMTCTLYQSLEAVSEPAPKAIYRMPWWRKYRLWIALVGLIVISLLAAVL